MKTKLPWRGSNTSRCSDQQRHRGCFAYTTETNVTFFEKETNTYNDFFSRANFFL